MSEKTRNILAMVMLVVLASSAFIAGYFTNDFVELQTGGTLVRQQCLCVHEGNVQLTTNVADDLFHRAKDAEWADVVVFGQLEMSLCSGAVLLGVVGMTE